MRTLIRGGRILDPATKTDTEADLLIEDGIVIGMGAGLDPERAEIVEAAGCWVAPGFVDMHTHLREPGQEYKEDIRSGGRAAAAGGFTSVACMANTQPVNDDPAVTKFIIDQAEKHSPVRVYPVAAATIGLAGEVMTEMSALREAGAVAFSDDGRGTEDANVMRHLLEYSKMVNAVVMVHAEDECLRAEGVVNEGFVSTQLGLPPNPSAAEDIRVARDISLARMTGARLHIAHVSSKRAVDSIRDARDEGLQVTAEVSLNDVGEAMSEATAEAESEGGGSEEGGEGTRSMQSILQMCELLGEEGKSHAASRSRSRSTLSRKNSLSDKPGGRRLDENFGSADDDLKRSSTSPK